ncbi:MAG: tetratricopeptide repeat protein [Proteobacteria bacterium]|nr:tetratricopeptide repeat protein [Pseudomonadota bacterium]
MPISKQGESRRKFLEAIVAMAATTAIPDNVFAAAVPPPTKSNKKTGAEWCKMELSNALAVAVPLVFEECHTKAKYTKTDSQWNIGYSMTSMPKDKKKPAGKWRKVKSGDTCTEDEAALWAGIYNQKNVYPTLKRLKYPISFGMFLALVDFSYNNGKGPLGKMVARLNHDWSEKEVLNQMLKYRYSGGTVYDGLIVRVWWRYMIGMNKCDYKKLPNCKLTAVSHIGSKKLYSDRAKYKPIVTPEKVNAVLTATPKAPSIADIFNRSPNGKKYLSVIKSMGAGYIVEAEADNDSDINKDNTLGFEAQEAFDQGDFKTAETKFKELIAATPGEYDSYNDLIFTLYKLGKYDEALQYAATLIDMAHKNKEPEDKLFGAAYYNAGLCREAKGELETALKNYNTAGIRMPDSKKVQEAKQRVTDALAGKKDVPKTPIEEVTELYLDNDYEGIIRKLTGQIGRLGLNPSDRAILWYVLADALRREAITQEKSDYYRQSFNAYDEVGKTDPNSEFTASAKTQKGVLKDNGRVEVQNNGTAKKGVENYDPLPEDEWLKGKLTGLSGGKSKIGTGFKIGAGIVTTGVVGAVLIGLNKRRKRMNEIAASKKSNRRDSR